MKTIKATLLILLISFTTVLVGAQKTSLVYTVKMQNPEWHFFQVHLSCKGVKKPYVDFKMPVWTPGYYQRLDFSKNIERFKATDGNGKELKWQKPDENTFRVASNHTPVINLSYEVKAERSFVATPYLDENRAYILPAGIFLYIDKMINQPVQINVVPDKKWNRVATGLDSIAGKKYVYTAPDFDILYDSPILAGDLDELPSFKVKGITHRFIGYKVGEFDKSKFIADLKKIVEGAVKMIGDIPYKHYTFIGIGPGQGGIEHLNNTTFGFNGNNLDRRENYIRTLHFLAHEYFHHYNVKRIRPVELGPFDYDKGNRTKMLWISEGLSVYYEYMLVKRAGITTDEELLNAFRGNMMAFENKPGKKFQTLEQASYETWSDGPFGRTGDEINKTISYYDKGPVVGVLFDFKIRELTKNERSLDDVMRLLYKDYYQKKKRGFTEEELKKAFDTVADTSLNDVYEYVTTTSELDYPKYFQYAGLTIDTSLKQLPGAWSGIATRDRNDSTFITTVDFESPGWNAGLRRGMPILEINKQKASSKLLQQSIATSKAGDVISISVMINEKAIMSTINLGTKTERTFQITPLQNPGPLQKQILESWLKG